MFNEAYLQDMLDAYYEYDYEEEFLQAIKNNDIAEVKNLLPKVDVNTTDSFGYSALFYAVERRYMDIADVLVKAGANLNDDFVRCFSDRATFAAEPAQQFLDLGANINAVTLSGRTALSVASKRGEKEAVKFLLEAGADPNIVGKAYSTGDERTALSEAMTQRTAQSRFESLWWPSVKEYNIIIDMLTKAGADPGLVKCSE